MGKNIPVRMMFSVSPIILPVRTIAIIAPMEGSKIGPVICMSNVFLNGKAIQMDDEQFIKFILFIAALWLLGITLPGFLRVLGVI
jgi:hypothetical protein